MFGEEAIDDYDVDEDDEDFEDDFDDGADEAPVLLILLASITHMGWLHLGGEDGNSPGDDT